MRVTAGAPSPFELEVPGDPSSAAFFVVAATITPGSELVVEDVALNPSRHRVRRRAARAWARRSRSSTTGERLGEPVGELRVASAPLHGTDVEGAEIPGCIDEIPVLAVAAAFAEGVTEFRDAAELRVKESDRIATVRRAAHRARRRRRDAAPTASSCGAAARAGASSTSHGDHRIAMAGAVAADAIEGETRGARLARRSATSYPEFAARPRRRSPGRAA